MTKLDRLETYVFDFFSARFEDLELFHRATYRDRRSGIYELKSGSKLMDFLHAIHGNIEDQFCFKKLIPHKFATPDALLIALDLFGKYLEDNQKYIDANIDGDNTNYIVIEIQKIKNEIVQAIDYAKIIYDYEDTKIPYQELRYKLITNNIRDFVEILKSILASVSYAITKTKAQEGYFHSNAHLILKLLGFEVISEELTNNGRIDAVIRFSDKIYILEFKFDKNQDLSKEAIQQIKDKEYALKFLTENKAIYGIGISFSIEARNINGFRTEKLNE